MPRKAKATECFNRTNDYLTAISCSRDYTD